MAQRLGLYTSTAGGAGLIPGEETKTPRAMLCSQKIKAKAMGTVHVGSQSSL